MMQALDSLRDIAGAFDAIVFDQWGVLHDGTRPYPSAIATVTDLAAAGHRLAVLSNSGKRAEINRDRITGKGFAPDAFETVMTSGEALWSDIADGTLPGLTSLYPITADPTDAATWAAGLDVTLTGDITAADAILLMGLPDGADHSSARTLIAAHPDLPILCSNPDRASPRGDGGTVISPGALAHEAADAGHDVRFYGKPHRPIFDAVARQMQLTDPARILMIGDSPEHDIAGAHAAGWQSLFIAGGLHRDHAGPLDTLFADHPAPTYTLPILR